MYLRKLINFFRTLSFRLTLWYGGIFTLSSCLVFLLFYIVITTFIFEQTDKKLLKQADILSRIFSIQGIDAVKRYAGHEVLAAGERKMFIRLLYPSGKVFSSSNMIHWKDVNPSPLIIRKMQKDANIIFDTENVNSLGHSVRILYSTLGPGFVLQLGMSMDDYTRVIEAFNRIFLYIILCPILMASIVGWFLAKKALSGIGDVTMTAADIAAGDLAKRVPVRAVGDEIDNLAITFNRMLDKIQALISGIKELGDNVAHDLKSPVTRIRGLAEITLTTGEGIEDYQGMAGDTIEECDRLLDMINTMLVISRTEAGAGMLIHSDFDLKNVVESACELFQPIAEDRSLSLVCRTTEPCPYSGDIKLIQRMIANLLDNAIKYTKEGTITVTLEPELGYRLRIKDSGMGISSEDQVHIFDRFYRCDPSRTETGSGLGLSLVKTIIIAHGGEITVSSVPGAGTEFTVLFRHVKEEPPAPKEKKSRIPWKPPSPSRKKQRGQKK